MNTFSCTFVSARSNVGVAYISYKMFSLLSEDVEGNAPCIETDTKPVETAQRYLINREK